MMDADEVDQVVEKFLSTYKPARRWVLAFAVAIVVILAIILFGCGGTTASLRQSENLWTCDRPCIHDYDCWGYSTPPLWSICEHGACTPYAYARILRR